MNVLYSAYILYKYNTIIVLYNDTKIDILKSYL